MLGADADLKRFARLEPVSVGFSISVPPTAIRPEDVTVPERKFMRGDPMNPATKVSV